MHSKNQRPIFVPAEHRVEIEKISKAALMDMAWDYAQQIAGSEYHETILAEFRKRRDIILTHRKNGKKD